ncbi:MAG: hypothetical protein WA949_22370, partial [Phormidesmis sp.]
CASTLAGYRIAEVGSTYGDIRQRWLVVESSQRQISDLKALEKGLCLDMEKFWPPRTFDALFLTSFQCFQAFLLNKAHQG